MDTRKFAEFEKGYVPGSINIPLDSQFAIWAATILDFDKPILLVNEKGRDEEAVRRLTRTGLHHIEGYLEGGFDNWLHHKKPFEKAISITGSELMEKIRNNKLPGEVIDIRNLNEWSEGVYDKAILLNLN